VDDFSYRLGATGTVLNPLSTSLPFVDITSVDGFDSADLRTTERDHEGVDGGFLDAEFEKMRTVTLEGRLFATVSTAETFLDTLKGEWSPRGIVPLYFQHPGVPERLLQVKPLGVRYSVNQLRNMGSCDIQFMCQAEDPRVYSSTLNSVNVAQGTTVTTGFGFPLGFPFGFGAVVSPSSTTITVGGNRPTPVTITITGPVSNPVIYNDTVGKYLAFTLEVASGQTLVIDTYYRTAKLNGTLSRRSALTNPGWFDLQPGMNTLRYGATSVGGVDAVLTYRDAWR
jgi:hypothetical protein